MNDIQNKLTLTVEEAAEYLGVCRPTLLELTRTGEFPAFRIGRRVLISRAGLEEWVAEQAGCGHSETPAHAVLRV